MHSRDVRTAVFLPIFSGGVEGDVYDGVKVGDAREPPFGECV